MTIEPVPVNPWTQLSLLPPTDHVLTLRVSLNHLEESATVVLEVQALPADEMEVILVRPMVGFDEVDTAVRDIGREFTRWLHELSGPFARP